MFHYIEKLRTKEEGTKKKIAFIIAFCFALILFSLWLTVFLPQFKKDQESESRVGATSGAKSPVNNFVDALSSGIVQIQKNFSEAKEIISNISTSTSYYVANSASTTSISTQELNN